MDYQKEHAKSTLMHWSKEQLVDYCLTLEHNINVLNRSFDNQYNNCVALLENMRIMNDTYKEAKRLIESVMRGK